VITDLKPGRRFETSLNYGNSGCYSQNSPVMVTHFSASKTKLSH
jgi:hypothetical protein